MHILSVEWIAFMAGCVGVYWLLPHRWRDVWVVAITALFLGLMDWRSLVILTLYTGLTCLAAQADLKRRWVIFAIGILMVAGLVYYKLLPGNQGTDDWQGLVIPLGMSYYTFRCLHYLWDRYRQVQPAAPVRHIVAYLFFLPTIIIGPIHRTSAFFNDLKTKQWNADDLSPGMERILVGYAKVVFIGDFLISSQLAQATAPLGAESEAAGLYFQAIVHALNLYFQFAGFSDVAIGFALLLGYRVMENFDSPFLKPNIALFWRSWHMSLTSFSRDYVYMTLIGMTRNPYIATYGGFIMIGLWHGVAFSWLYWGLYHATGIIVWMQWQRLKRRLKLPRLQAQPWKGTVHTLAVLATAHFFFLGSICLISENPLDVLGAYYTLLVEWWLP